MSSPAGSPAPTICIVDDDLAALTGLSRLLRSAGFAVAAFSSSREFLERHDPDAHGCLILDLAMPELDGLELQQVLAAGGGALPIVFLTGHGDIPKSVRAMKAGADDFLTKPVRDADLLEAVRAAVERDRLQRQARADAAEIAQRLATLTPRERQVLEHVVAGQLNKQAAADLGIVEKTVKVHRARVMRKMKVQSVAELVRLAERAGIGASIADGPGRGGAGGPLDEGLISQPGETL